MLVKKLKVIISVGIWLLLVAGPLFYFSSCKKSLSTRPGWNTTLLTPLVTSTLSFNNLVNDTLLKKGTDSSLQLVYRNSLYSFNPAQQNYKIPDTTLNIGYSVNNLKLANQSITYRYSLGQLAQQIGGTEGSAIILASTFHLSAPITPFGDSTFTEDTINATQFFHSATLDSGFITIKITNGFPVPIDKLIFTIGNYSGNGFHSTVTFLNIQPHQSASQTINLAGQTVEGTLKIQILKIYSSGSNGASVPIDTSNAITSVFSIFGLKVQSATAYFPSQNLIDQDQPNTYNLSGGARLKKIRIKTGTLQLTVVSTVDDSTHFSVDLPGALSPSGQPLTANAVLPPAKAPGKSTYTKTYPLDGYTMDLSAGLGYNTYLSHFIARIDSSHELATLSSSDSIHIFYGLLNIVPDYVSGYLGQQIVGVGPSTQAFTLFDRIKSGSLSLENVAVDLGIENGVGVDGRLTLYKLSSTNSTANKTVSLTSSGFVKTPLFVPRATDNPLTPSFTTFHLNNTNSNIKALIENLPNSLLYNFDVFINPSGNSHNYTDFAYSTSELNVSLDLTVPLSVIANELTFQDTVDFNLGQTNSNGTSAIKDGTFNLIADNGFPLKANMQLYLYDNSGNFIDSLMAAPHVINAGVLNSNCRVEQKTETVIQIPVSADKMNKIRGAKRAIIRAAFTTASSPTCNGYQKIYSDYTMKVQLTGKFTYYTGE